MVGPVLFLAALATVPYGPGERMAFSVTYLGMRVGLAYISTQAPDGELLPVKLEARTVGIGSIYKLDEVINCALDPATGLPVHSQLLANEGGHKHVDTTHFDRQAGTATVTRQASTSKTDVVPIQPDTTDLLSLVYRLRTVPLAAGDRQTFPVLSGNKLRVVEAVVEGPERLKTQAGAFDTLRIRVPTGFGGKFSEKNPTYVWLSDDARRVVVRLSTDFAIGHATADLKSYTPPAAAGGEAADPP